MGKAETDALGAVGGAAFTDSPCLMTVIDRDLNLARVNHTFVSVFGARRGEPCHRVYKGCEQPCERCFVRQVFADGQARSAEERGVTLEGKEIRYRASAVPLRDEQGEVTLVLHMAQDMTELLALRHGLDEAERLASVGLTMAGMAHTIKNILGGLEGGIYVVDSGLEQDNQARIQGGWEMVKKYIEQVTILVKNLLRYSRPEAPTREEVAPAELVAEAAGLYESKAALVGVEVIKDVESGLPSLVVDREGLMASLTNLVSDSMDACIWDPEGHDKELRITVAARRSPDGGVTFEVRDTGTGISEENQPKVLSAFFTTKGIRGTGLGLLLTRKTVEAHGGEIEFESVPGEGTTFRITLPPALIGGG